MAPNELGAVSLVLVGATLAALAILGLVPIRLQIRDLEFVLAEFVEEALDIAGPDGAQRILARAEEILPPTALDAVRTRVEGALGYEHDVLTAVKRVADPDTEVTLERTADAVVKKGNRRVYIEVKSGLLASGRRTQEVMDRMRRLRGRWLLVTDVPPSAWAARLLTSQEVAWVEWRGPTDDEALRRGLASALEGATSDEG